MSDGIEELVEVTRALVDRIDKLAPRDGYDHERPMTREEVAAFLECHADTVYRWAKEGHLAYSKLGDGEKAPMRFKLADVQEFAFQRRRIPTNSEARNH